MEDYLKCLLSVLLPKPATGDGKSKENHDVITILSKRKLFFPSLQSISASRN